MAGLEDDPGSARVLRSETVFTGKVWSVRRDEFDYAGRMIAREYVDHTGAVAVLALDEDDRVALIKQYRHPIRCRDWEIPAGLLDVMGEDPLVAAQRELAEEADLVAETWHNLAEFYTTPGGSNEAIRIYLARGLRASHEEFERTDEEAGIELRWVSLDDLVDAVLARAVQNPSLALGALTAHTSRARGWRSLGDPAELWTRHPRLGAGRPAPDQVGQRTP